MGGSIQFMLTSSGIEVERYLIKAVSLRGQNGHFALQHSLID